MRFVWGIGIGLAVAGCTPNLQVVSAGRVGCPASAVRIIGKQKTLYGWSWQAICRGETFQCSATEGDVDCRSTTVNVQAL